MRTSRRLLDGKRIRVKPEARLRDAVIADLHLQIAQPYREKEIIENGADHLLLQALDGHESHDEDVRTARAPPKGGIERKDVQERLLVLVAVVDRARRPAILLVLVGDELRDARIRFHAILVQRGEERRAKLRAAVDDRLADAEAAARVLLLLHGKTLLLDESTPKRTLLARERPLKPARAKIADAKDSDALRLEDIRRTLERLAALLVVPIAEEAALQDILKILAPRKPLARDVKRLKGNEDGALSVISSRVERVLDRLAHEVVHRAYAEGNACEVVVADKLAAVVCRRTPAALLPVHERKQFFHLIPVCFLV